MPTRSSKSSNQNTSLNIVPILLPSEDIRFSKDDGAIVPIEFRESLTEDEVEPMSDSDGPGNDEEYPQTPTSSEGDSDDIQSESNVEIDPHAHFALGQSFADKAAFKAALFRYSVEEKYDVSFYVSKMDKVGAKCRDNNCKWRIYCSIDQASKLWKVKVFERTHSCERTGKTKMLNIGTIASLFSSTLRTNPTMKISEMREYIENRWQLEVSSQICRQAKKKALKFIKKEWEEQFSWLNEYVEEIKKSNPMISTEIGMKFSDNGQVFDRFYICFGVIRDLWKETCRKVIGLNEISLKWELKGRVLAAIGRDGNNHIFPIAWAIVTVEDAVNWDWFIQKLKSDLNLGSGNGVTLICDNQKGLLNALQYQLPEAEHRMCARYVYANWKKHNRDVTLKPYFWKIVCAYTMPEFQDALNNLHSFSREAYSSFLNAEPNKWCRAFFKTSTQFPDVYNNFDEPFNRTIKESSTKPIVDLLEDIRRQVMGVSLERLDEAKKWEGVFTPWAQAEIEKERKRSTECRVVMETNGTFDVMDKDNMCYQVNVHTKTCTCRRWDLTGLPCRHAIRAISDSSMSLESYVSDYFTTLKWQRTYAASIVPINASKFCSRAEHEPLIPPTDIVIPERPKNRRGKDQQVTPMPIRGKASKKGSLMRCTNCKGAGHNKRSCKNLAIAIETTHTPKKRGRPRHTIGDIIMSEGESLFASPSDPQPSRRVNDVLEDIPDVYFQ